MSSSVSKEDAEIHKKALKALSHYYQYKDYTLISRVVESMPKSNRRIALLKWIQEYSILRWDSQANKITRLSSPEIINIEGAKLNPFWNFKIKQQQKKHISGNYFESQGFLENLIFQIGNNLDKFSISEIEIFSDRIRKLVERKKSKNIN